MAIGLEEARRIMPGVRRELHAHAHVQATGIGYKRVKGKKTGDLALICSVDVKQSKRSLSSSELVPATIGGIPTDVNPTGVLCALQAPTGRFRPAPSTRSM
jgi:hypothetical protein